MERTRARAVKVGREGMERLMKAFGCTQRMVYKALGFDSDTALARRIRHTALKETGGWIEASVPEDEIFYVSEEGGERVMRQYFRNGAVLEVSLTTSRGRVMLKGVCVKAYGEVKVSEIPEIQNWARSL